MAVVYVEKQKSEARFISENEMVNELTGEVKEISFKRSNCKLWLEYAGYKNIRVQHPCGRWDCVVCSRIKKSRLVSQFMHWARNYRGYVITFSPDPEKINHSHKQCVELTRKFLKEMRQLGAIHYKAFFERANHYHCHIIIFFEYSQDWIELPTEIDGKKFISPSNEMRQLSARYNANLWIEQIVSNVASFHYVVKYVSKCIGSLTINHVNYLYWTRKGFKVKLMDQVKFFANRLDMDVKEFLVYEKVGQFGPYLKFKATCLTGDIKGTVPEHLNQKLGPGEYKGKLVFKAHLQTNGDIKLVLEDCSVDEVHTPTGKVEGV